MLWTISSRLTLNKDNLKIPPIFTFRLLPAISITSFTRHTPLWFVEINFKHGKQRCQGKNVEKR